MRKYNYINNQLIKQLTRKQLLEQRDFELLERQAKWVFAEEPVVTIPKIKEEALIKKLKHAVHLKECFNWIFIATIILSAVGLFFIWKQPDPPKEKTKQEPQTKTATTPAVNNDPPAVDESKLVKNRRIGPATTSDRYSLKFNGGQLVEKILNENADCMNPILVKDTVVFSPHTPIGIGNELEFLNNDPNDELYLENEHNTVWYKFWPPEDGILTFDIIPVDPHDDYDFMLFRYNGGDFRSKILSKQLKPIRTCISRNDTSIKGTTGLSMNEPSTFFVHSGIGQSYVKYMEVKKGETFYLLVDNVYTKGNGHMIRFHYRPFDPRQLYVGKSMVLTNIMFLSDDYAFKPGSKEGLDSLYRFLQNNPTLKVEIQGHVNTGSGARPIGYGIEELAIFRAQAIYKYLIDKGIPSERLTYEGYGDRRKKVQIPKTKKEYCMNILADILILSLDYKADLEWKRDHPAQAGAPH